MAEHRQHQENTGELERIEITREDDHGNQNSGIKQRETTIGRIEHESQGAKYHPDRINGFANTGFETGGSDSSSSGSGIEDGASLADRISQIALDEEERIRRASLGTRPPTGDNQERLRVRSASNGAQALGRVPRILIQNSKNHLDEVCRKGNSPSPTVAVVDGRNRAASEHTGPERGDLRELDRIRSECRSVDPLAGSGRISLEKEQMINIQRSTWTLSDFDQTFTKAGNMSTSDQMELKPEKLQIRRGSTGNFIFSSKEGINDATANYLLLSTSRNSLNYRSLRKSNEETKGEQQVTNSLVNSEQCQKKRISTPTVGGKFGAASKCCSNMGARINGTGITPNNEQSLSSVESLYCDLKDALGFNSGTNKKVLRRRARQQRGSKHNFNGLHKFTNSRNVRKCRTGSTPSNVHEPGTDVEFVHGSIDSELYSDYSSDSSDSSFCGKKNRCKGGKGCWSMVKTRVPLLEWLPTYKWVEWFPMDLMAGLIVAVLNISTSLSAAVVAETDLGLGFRASIVNTLVYSILSSSRHVSFGSWSIMSQMLLVGVQRALSDELILSRLKEGGRYWSQDEFERWHRNIIIMDTFLIGLYQLAFGLLNLGNTLASFIPEALCSSMIAATAISMAMDQLANMAGTSNKILWSLEKNSTDIWADLRDPPLGIDDLFGGLFRWVGDTALLVKFYDHINPVCVLMSTVTLLLLYMNQNIIQGRIDRMLGRKILIPCELFIIVLIIPISWWLDLSKSYKVLTCGSINIDFGIPNLPDLRLIRELWSQSLATALISYTMVFIMAKTYSNRLNYEVDVNQELIACGAGNLIGGLFDALPATASFSRTASQVEAGGQTQMASIVNCVVLCFVTQLLGHLVAYLPVCVMAAFLFFGFVRMMTRSQECLMYWRICKVDFAIWLVTFVSILALDIVNGFIFGLLFSILTMLYRAQKRRCYMLGIVASADVFVPLLKYPSSRELEGIKIFQFCGPVHYGCSDMFEQKLRRKTKVNVKQILQRVPNEILTLFDPRSIDLPSHIVLDFSMISYIDSAGLRVIKKIIEDYNKINIIIMFASLASHVASVIKSDPSLWDAYKDRFYLTLADAVHRAISSQSLATRVSITSARTDRVMLESVLSLS